MAAGIVFAGYWSDAASAQRVLSWGCAATVGIGFLFGPSLASGSWPVVALGLSASLFVMGLVYGPLGMWLPGLFPVRVRYTGASVAFKDRKSVVSGKSGSVRVDLGGRRFLKKQKTNNKLIHSTK